MIQTLRVLVAKRSSGKDWTLSATLDVAAEGVLLIWLIISRLRSEVFPNVFLVLVIFCFSSFASAQNRLITASENSASSSVPTDTSTSWTFDLVHANNVPMLAPGLIKPVVPQQPRFKWKEAVNQSLYFLSLEHGYRMLQGKTRREFGGRFSATTSRRSREFGAGMTETRFSPIMSLIPSKARSLASFRSTMILLGFILSLAARKHTGAAA